VQTIGQAERWIRSGGRAIDDAQDQFFGDLVAGEPDKQTRPEQRQQRDEQRTR
jgi:hypothetical protein